MCNASLLIRNAAPPRFGLAQRSFTAFSIQLAMVRQRKNRHAACGRDLSCRIRYGLLMKLDNEVEFDVSLTHARRAEYIRPRCQSGVTTNLETATIPGEE